MQEILKVTALTWNPAVSCLLNETTPGRLSHGADPDVVLNLPSTHAVHGPPSGPVESAGHFVLQAVAEVLCTGEVEFDGQLLHAAGPVSALYVPMSHAVHDPPEIVNPALQMQASWVVLCVGESEFAG